MNSNYPRLKINSVTKRYPAVVANDSVSLTVMPGQIHALLGENGAGKSTLMKIIYGVVQADSGTIELDGQPVLIKNPAMARSLGIAMVFQHFSVFETLTVAQNVFLGLSAKPGEAALTLEQVTQKITEVASAYGLFIDPARTVHSLSVGERQRVEILRALLTDPRVLILDEPTSVLTPQAVHTLFTTLRKLAATGCSIIYISHKLDEIRELCEACTVLRGGRNAGQIDPRRASAAQLAQLMIGTDPPKLVRQLSAAGQQVLKVEHLSLSREDPFGVDLKDVNLELCSGEIVGIAGVSGNGQQALLASLSGESTRAPANSITLQGQPIATWSSAQRRVLGIHFVPEERLGRGALPTMTLAQNTLLSRADAGLVRKGWFGFEWINWSNAANLAQSIIEKFSVKAGGHAALASSLSGGNLQKFIMGREITSDPKVLIVAQPTWGVDVGASAQIRQALITLRNSGCAVLVVSEELEELFEITDRMYVMAQGKLSPSIPTVNANSAQIGRWMSGMWDQDTTSLVDGEAKL